jgi:hypothetical protein
VVLYKTCEAIIGELICVVFLFLCCQFGGWSKEHWIMQYVCVEGSMLPNVNMNLGFCGTLDVVLVHMV